MAKVKDAGAPPATDAGAKESAEKPRRGDPFEGLRFEDCKPYTGKQDLPLGRLEVDNKPIVNDRGEVVQRSGKPVLWCGSPRFLMEQTKYGWINLIGKYRKGESAGSRLVRTLKTKQPPEGSAPAITERWKRDVEILKKLHAQKIPTYMEGQTP